MKKIGLITCAPEKLKDYFPTLVEPDFIPTEPPFTPDDQIIVDTLRAENLLVEAVRWGIDIKKIESFDLLIMRSPWDYMDTDTHRHNFIQWLDILHNNPHIKIENSITLMKWLIDKHYMLELEKAGIPIVPTTLLKKGASFNLQEHYENKGNFILKPCISAAGKDLLFIDSLNKATEEQNHLNNLLATKDFLLQPFIKEIKTNGEWSLIFIDGQYSHAILKKPANKSILVHAENGGSLDFLEPPSNLVDFAQQNYQRFLKAFSNSHNPETIASTLYLRMDVIQTDTAFLVSECEGVEPELFFRAKNDSKHRFTQAVKRRLGIS